MSMSVQNPSNPLNVGVEVIAVITGCFLSGTQPFTNVTQY